jgi:Nup133 N terminal like
MGSGSNAGRNSNGNGGSDDASSSVSTVSPRLVHVKSIPLPPALREALKGARTHAFLGLLAPAQLGWVSVDDRLALWKLPPPASPLSSGSAMLLPAPSSTTNQQQQHQQPLNGGTTDDSSPICQFRVPSGQPIVTVGPVRPKPGAFVLHIDCLS